MKDDKLYLEHILDCINKIDAYTNVGKIAFVQTDLIQDGVIRNLEIIGEAAKRSMVLLSLEQYSALTDNVELKLDEADKAAQLTDERYNGKEVFTRVRKRING